MWKENLERRLGKAREHCSQELREILGTKPQLSLEKNQVVEREL
jgi:hypothetical protein